MGAGERRISETDCVIPTKEEMEKRTLAMQIEIMRTSLYPHVLIHTSFIEMTVLIEMMFNYMEKQFMDKKMHKVTQSMKKAESDIKKHEPMKAVKVLKGAEKKNEKLVKIDKNVRDPIIEKAKKKGIK